MRIAIYSRKSVESDRGESMANQVLLCREYIALHLPEASGAELLLFEDEGYSGKSTDRPQLQRLLQEQERSPFVCIVCYRLDRISRSISDFSVLIERLSRAGTAFISIREQFDTSSPMGRAMMYIASVFAQLERETIAERVRDNMLLLARGGRWLGGTPPTGYRSARGEECILDGKAKSVCRLVPDEAECRIVHTVFQSYLARRSLRKVSLRLKELGMTNRAGEPFSLAGLKDILRNPVYCAADAAAWDYFRSTGADVCFTPTKGAVPCGLLAYNKRQSGSSGTARQGERAWIVAAGRHPGLIPGRDWVQVQRLLSANRPRVSVHTRNEYALLSGLLHCGRCGAPLRAKRRGGGSARFDYICCAKAEKGCSCPNLPGPEADAMIWEALFTELPPEMEFLPSMRHLQAERRREASSERAAHAAALRRELHGLISLLAAQQDGPAAQHIRVRISSLDTALRALEQPGRSLPPLPDDAAALGRALASLRGAAALFTLQERRDLLRLMAAQVTWDGEALFLLLRQF